MPERFCTYLADTVHAEHLHHHLRYKVYCERKHYEEGTLVEDLPQEWDEYDPRAARFIIKDKYQDSWIGTARLVANDTQPLPAQRLGAFDQTYTRLLAEQPAAEVSRLATVCCYQSTQCTVHLLQSVIVSALGHSHGRGIEWLVFLVSPALARILGKVGVPMEPCGPEILHRGTRRAYRSHVESGIGLVPWTRCLRQGYSGYELFSSEVADGAAREAA